MRRSKVSFWHFFLHFSHMAKRIKSNKTRMRRSDDKHLFAIIGGYSSHFARNSPRFWIDKWSKQNTHIQAVGRHSFVNGFLFRFVFLHCLLAWDDDGWVWCGPVCPFNSSHLTQYNIALGVCLYYYNRNARRFVLFSFLLTLFPWTTKCSCTTDEWHIL